VLFARGVRGDVLLAAPRLPRPRARKPYAARRVAPGAATDDDTAPLAAEPAPAADVAAQERLGRRTRRFLEHYVGSEARKTHTRLPNDASCARAHARIASFPARRSTRRTTCGWCTCCTG
jgi:hypothetical protein